MTYKYHNSETGKVEEVQPERWGWRAVYNDNTELKQFADDGTFNRLAAIDKNKLAVFSLYKLDEPQRNIIIRLMPNMKFVHYYFNVHPYWLDNFTQTFRVYCVGYNQYRTQDDYVMVRIFVLPDDQIIVSNEEDIDLAALINPPTNK